MAVETCEPLMLAEGCEQLIVIVMESDSELGCGCGCGGTCDRAATNLRIEANPDTHTLLNKGVVHCCSIQEAGHPGHLFHAIEVYQASQIKAALQLVCCFAWRIEHHLGRIKPLTDCMLHLKDRCTLSTTTKLQNLLHNTRQWVCLHRISVANLDSFREGIVQRD